MTTDQPLLPGAHVHCLGLGGFGINPIARVLHDLGYAVSGCDAAESPLLNALRAQEIPALVGHSPEHLDWFRPDALVISSAIPPGNPEVQEAAARGIPVYKRSDILCALMRDRLGVAIAGTHGKTTTTGMAALVLTGCGLDPTFIVGGVLNDMSTNARAGGGDLFLIEADEYDRMFLGLCPRIAVVTTLELDHPDMFGSLADVEALFAEFVERLPEDGLLIAGFDNEPAYRLAAARLDAGRPAISYGLTGGDWTAADVQPNPCGGMDFRALWQGEEMAQVSLQVPGLHNVQNALAVLAAAAAVGAPLEQAAGVLGSFTGVGRRFEVKGEAQGVTVIDDYAHHPTAIRATLSAARARYGERRIWAVWQPHTYSRTRALLDEFAASFADADHVIITDVYRSRDTGTYGIGPADVLNRMADHPDAQHIAALADVVGYLAASVQPGDVVIVMSAGDATSITGALLAALEG